MNGGFANSIIDGCGCLTLVALADILWTDGILGKTSGRAVNGTSNTGAHAHLPAIQVTNLTHTFPRHRVPVLHNLSFAVYPGQWLVVVGPNEAGKSTLVRILATLIRPSQGHVAVCGYDVVRAPRAVRRRVGVLLDSERAFYYRLTAYQNLAFFAALYGLSARTIPQRVQEVLEMVGLAHARDRRFTTFSAGMRRRLALARALLRDVPVYLLDEPTAHLSPEDARAVLALIAGLRARGRAILTTAHTVAHLDHTPDLILHLERR